MKEFFIQFGAITHFGFRVLKQLFRPPYDAMEFFKQSYLLGYKTLSLIIITGFILGLVLTLQSMPVLYEFGAESMLPGMIAVSVIREIGPVITALICAGKMASGIGAELGSMRVTEQIDAMEVTGINPVNYLVLNRVMATTFMVPILVVFADFVALVGSYIAVQINQNVQLILFMRQAFESLAFIDVIPALIKTFFFGFFIGIIGCYEGYFCQKGTEAVGMASNAAVVKSSLAIFFINLIAVQATIIITRI